jgi:flagellar assembly factor FliW
MKYQSRQFGELEVDERQRLFFPEGMIGFEQCRNYTLAYQEDTEPFRWLISLDDSDLCFPLLDPRLLEPGYGSRLPVDSAEVLYVVATLHTEIDKSTVNLRSPVVINPTTQTGRQIILEDESLPFQYPLFAHQQSGEGG